MFDNISQRDELLSYMRDGHRDAYGHRPSADTRARWDAMSYTELQIEADEISNDVGHSIEIEERAHDDAEVRFENHINDMIAAYGVSRETAIRWDMEAEGVTEDDVAFYGMDHYAYIKGLRFNYFKKQEQAA